MHTPFGVMMNASPPSRGPRTRRMRLIGAAPAVAATIGLLVGGIPGQAQAAPPGSDYTITGLIETPAGVDRADYLEGLTVETNDGSGTVDFDSITGEYTISGLVPDNYSVYLVGTMAMNGIVVTWERPETRQGGGAGEGINADISPAGAYVPFTSPESTAPTIVAPTFGAIALTLDLTDANLTWIRFGFWDVPPVGGPTRQGIPVPENVKMLPLQLIVYPGRYGLEIDPDGEYTPVVSLVTGQPVFASVPDFTVPEFGIVNLGTLGGAAQHGGTTVVLSDVSGDSSSPVFSAFAAEISWLAERGITTGYPNGDGTSQFRPFGQVTRDAMAAFLYRYAGSPEFTPPVVSPFSDVPTSNGFYKEITWLASTGVTTGWDVGGGVKEFRPFNPITRDAMAAFLYRYAGNPAFTPPGSSPFTDVPTSNGFYKEITWLASTGITTGWDVGGGVKEFRPYNNITRDAMAAFLYRYNWVAPEPGL